MRRESPARWWRPAPAVILLVALGATLAPRASQAWANHTPLSWAALAADPALVGLAPVAAETLDQFLAPNEAGLASLLEAAEGWSRRAVPTWPALPPGLGFTDGRQARPARQRFVEAARLNPGWAFPLFVQLVPGAAPTPGRRALAEGELVPAGVGVVPPRRFEALQPGEPVSPLQVVTSAADEPDYGLDMGLFEDSGTPAGARYHLGAQSVGNPRLAYGTQAPFHMGFFHEPGVVYAAAGFLRRMYPEQRIHLFLELARYAFATRHDYWGWRFLGLALHYVQDLGQPWHATLLPGRGAAGAIWNNLLAMLGLGGAKAAMITLATNRHLVLEDLAMRLVHAGFASGRVSQAVIALGDRTVDDGLGPYDDQAPRARITARARERAAAVDQLLGRLLPPRLVDDPAYTYSVSEPAVDVLALLEGGGGGASPPGVDPPVEQLDRALAVLLADVGGWTRLAVRCARAPR